MLAQRVDHWIACLTDVFRRLLGGKFAPLKLTVGWVVISFWFALPNYDVMLSDLSGNWRALLKQAQDPFVAHHYDPASHEAKMTLRLVPPLIGHVLKLEVPGYFILQILSFVTLGYVLAKLLLRATEDAAETAFCMIALATSVIGAICFSDGHGFFDSVALAFIGLAMLARRPVLIIFCIVLGGFTDERALIAAPLIYGYFLSDGGRLIPPTLRAMIIGNARTASVVAGFLVCLALRYALFVTFGLATPQPPSHVAYLLANRNELGVGFWSALEGGWILIFTALLLLFVRRAWLGLLALSGGIALVLLAGFAVIDISRSLVYVYPALILAVGLIVTLEPSLRALFFWAMVISVVWPTYYVSGGWRLEMLFPLPLSLSRFFH